MNLLIGFGVLSFLFSGVISDVRYRGNAVHPDYPGQCYYQELEQPIPKTQILMPINRKGLCLSIYCRPDYVLELNYCGRHNLHPNETCQLESDLRSVFPKCCPKLVCHDEQTNKI